jgi:hypothetical protein
MLQARVRLEEKETMKRYGLLIILVISLAACAAPPTSAPAATMNTSPLTIQSPLPTASIAPLEPAGVTPATTDGRVAVFPAPIIVYQREGGITGKSEKWTIYPTGRIMAGDGTEWQVPAEQVKPLFDLVESPDFGKLNDSYPATGACDDCYTHTLTVYWQGEPKTVTFVESAVLPTSLQQMLGEINRSDRILHR